MTDLKLTKLPDRTPVKLAITVPPELHRALSDYAFAYEATYGKAESVGDLIPYMLQSFIDADKAFAKRRNDKSPSGRT